MSELVTDAMVEAAAKELYEQWVSRDNLRVSFAPVWGRLGSFRKSEWLQDARIALEAAAPAIAAKAREGGYQACRNRPRADGCPTVAAVTGALS